MKTSLYLLWHTYEKESGDEDIKLIGVYSSEDRAKEALEKVRVQPGFRDYPDGFEISVCPLNATDWREGFAEPWDTDADGNEVDKDGNIVKREGN